MGQNLRHLSRNSGFRAAGAVGEAFSPVGRGPGGCGRGRPGWGAGHEDRGDRPQAVGPVSRRTVKAAARLWCFSHVEVAVAVELDDAGAEERSVESWLWWTASAEGT